MRAPWRMDSWIRGIKQIGTGLKFTMDKEICNTPVYTAYKGRYKNKKSTIFKYKGIYADKAAEAFPLLKHITHPILAEVLCSQKTTNTFYIVTERVEPLEQEEYSLFVQSMDRRVEQCNLNLQNEHSIRVSSLNSNRVEKSELYFTLEGKPVVAGALPLFMENTSIPIPEPSALDKLYDILDRYNQCSKPEQMVAQDILKEYSEEIPRQYSMYIAKKLVEYIDTEGEEIDKKISTARALLHLQTEPPVVSLLFKVNNPQIRVLALHYLQEKSSYLTAEKIDGFFEDLYMGLFCNDEIVRRESISTIETLLGIFTKAQKEKAISGYGALVKKGRPKEKDQASALIVKNYLEFLECPQTLYSCCVCMMNSTEVPVKKNGILLIDKLKHIIEIRTLVVEVIPMVSMQSEHSEISEQALNLLCSLAERAKADVSQLKSADKWKVPGMGLLSRPLPLKPTQEMLQRQKQNQKKLQKPKQVEKPQKQKKSAWEDTEEW
ncbi:hypothetical protein NEOKW01_0376 [Nematocida sp. AWRm80]|nr:hypothetical protein NEOKW01_0376 [Nematocida sp. AWRm80]